MIMEFASVDLSAIMGELVGLAAVLGGFTIAGYAIFMGAKDRQQRLEGINRERLLLIEKGMDPALAFQKPKGSNGAKPLLWGLLFAGIGLGLLVGSQVARAMNIDGDKVALSSALLFGGLGMVIYYLYSNKVNAQKAD
jgi:hypothetical protein